MADETVIRTSKDVALRLRELADELPTKPVHLGLLQQALRGGAAEIEQLRARVTGNETPVLTICDCRAGWKGCEKQSGRTCAVDHYHRFVEPGAALKAGVARKDCKTCLGYGMVGGFVSPDSGYQSDPCPDCSPENGEGSQT